VSGRGAPIHVLSTGRFDDAWLADVAAASSRIVLAQHPAIEVDELPAELLARAEVLYTNSCLPTRAQAPALRWVQLDTSGADHVVHTPLWADGTVAVTSIGGVSPRPIAGYVMAMVLAFAHHVPELLDHQRRREWPTPEERWERFVPMQLHGSRMVIVGFGRLGRAIAHAARAFGIEVTGVRRGAAERPGERFGEIELADDLEVVGPGLLEDALARADHVVVTLPLTWETRGLVGATAFAALKPGATLVNVSRGGVVDEEAMARALADGTLAHVASDVFAREPLPEESPLWNDGRVIVSPHVAGFAPDYAEQVRVLFRANLTRYAEGRPLANLIDRTLGY
jgi:phosphoglycerate dehydrogenase-like enzyme